MNGRTNYDDTSRIDLEENRQRRDQAYERLRMGTIGKIEQISAELVGENVICLSREFSDDIVLTVVQVNEKNKTALVRPVEPGRGSSRSVPVADLRRHDAVEEYMNTAQETDGSF